MSPWIWALSVETCVRENIHCRTPNPTMDSAITPAITKGIGLRRGFEVVTGADVGDNGGAAGAGIGVGVSLRIGIVFVSGIAGATASECSIVLVVMAVLASCSSAAPLGPLRVFDLRHSRTHRSTHRDDGQGRCHRSGT